MHTLTLGLFALTLLLEGVVSLVCSSRVGCALLVLQGIYHAVTPSMVAQSTYATTRWVLVLVKGAQDANSCLAHLRSHFAVCVDWKRLILALARAFAAPMAKSFVKPVTWNAYILLAITNADIALVVKYFAKPVAWNA
jgi:hypothetical protein